MTQKRLSALRPLLKKGTPAALVGLGAAIVIGAGGLAAYWVIAQRKPVIASMPVGSNIIPQDALATLTFSTEPGQWRSLRQFGTPETQAVLDKNLAEFRDRFLTAYGYDYRRDIQPWIGQEITIAFLTAPTTVQTTGPNSNSNSLEPIKPAVLQQPMVMVLPIADAAAAQAVFAKTQSEAGQTWTTRNYKGVEIRESTSGPHPISAAVFGTQFVVVAPDDTALERIIDTYKGGESIASTPGYRQAIGQIAAADPFMRAYVNAPVARDLATANTIQPLPTQGMSPLQNNRGIAATLTLATEGIRIQGISWLDPDNKQRYQVQNTAAQAPKLLPRDTVLLISGGNLQQFWQTYSQPSGTDVDPKSLGNPANFRQAIQEATGLDLEQDLLSWMNGEFGLAVIPVAGQANTGTTAGIVLLTKAGDRSAADRALKRLDNVMSDRYRFKVSEDQNNGQPLVKWVSPFASLTVTRGWLSGDVAFMAIGSPATSDTLLKSTSSLEQSDTFRNVTTTDLSSNNGHFFIDVDRLLNSENSFPIPALPKNMQAFAKAIRAIGVTTAIQNERSARYDIQVLLHRTNNSNPLPTPSPVPSGSPTP
ncbi:MAG TPA: DUF3352 domain-containing protein [Crinalium sp.]